MSNYCLCSNVGTCIDMNLTHKIIEVAFQLIDAIIHTALLPTKLFPTAIFQKPR